MSGPRTPSRAGFTLALALELAESGSFCDSYAVLAALESLSYDTTSISDTATRKRIDVECIQAMSRAGGARRQSSRSN